jgi:hypothetical protein
MMIVDGPTEGRQSLQSLDDLQSIAYRANRTTCGGDR